MNYLHEYSTFETVEELNEAINDHIQRNQYELNDTDRNVFLMLSRYAVKYLGAAHLKTDTIAKAIGKSIRTVQRSIRKLERLGMIERVEFIRKKSGGHGANIYRILSTNVSAGMSEREPADKPTQASNKADDRASESINSISDNTYILETNKRADIIKRGLRNAIPKPIYNALAPFYDGKGVYDTYGILLRAKARIDRTIALESHHERYIDAFYNVIRRYKRGIVRNLDGYLFAAWERLSAEISRQMSVHEGDILAYNPYSNRT